ncbi:MAG: hypothetical protein PVG78_19760 [Desulfobacterales bacterium]|jgi:hypothetical protein
MKYRGLALVALFFLLFGCASSPESVPETPEAAFDPGRYLTAEGFGATEAEARREALGALAAVFESRVYSETASSAASFITDSAPEAFEKNVETKLRVESSVRLKGARIGSIQRDEKTGLYRALAILDRNQAAREWQEQMAMVDTRLQAEREALPDRTGRLIRMGALNRILEAALEKAALRSRLRVVGRAAVDAESFDLQPIANEAAALRSASSFWVNVEGEHADIVSNRIEKMLGDQGIGVVREPDRAAGTVAGAIGFTRLDLGNRKVHFVRAVLRLAVIDVDTGTQVASISEDLRKGHVDETEAMRMAAESVSERAAEALLAALGLSGFFQPGLSG